MAPPNQIFAGNWKMFKGPPEARSFFADFLPRVEPREDRSILFFPPAVALTAAVEAARGRTDVEFGVQNIHWEPSGAFTGEISATMAADAGARHALVGHSERRHGFGETIGQTARKVSAALAAGLRPVLCVGETLDERRAGRAQNVVREQLSGALHGVADDTATSLLIAYEPVWAIGTGETASPADAAAMHRHIRDELIRRFGEPSGLGIPILYGGSVKPDNARELLDADQVDGVLVGGASLDPAGFARICQAGH